MPGGRKLFAYLLTVVGILGYGVVMKADASTVVTGLVMALGVFSGANTAAGWAALKSAATPTKGKK